MPRKVPKDKVQLNVLISKEVYEKLIKVAPLIYGEKKYRGAISYVVEQALKHYLAPRLHTQTPANPPGRIRLLYSQIIEKIKEIQHFDFKPDEIPEKILDLAIAEVKGGDPRTIAKWKKQLQRFGLIKPIRGTYPNRIFELL